MTLDSIVEKIMFKLVQEAGASDWWADDEIGQYVNDLYRETAMEAKICKKRDSTTVTVAETQQYAVPVPTGYERILSILNVDYDSIPLTPVTPQFLDGTWYQWRSANSGTPEFWFFDYGYENTSVSLMRKPSAADKVVGFDLILLPNELSSTSIPKWPFADGFLLVDGVMSMALGKAGGGRDLDRSAFYWNKYISSINEIRKQLYPSKIHRLKSVDEIGIRVGLDNLSLLNLPVTE